MDFARINLKLINENNIRVLYEKPEQSGLESIKRLYVNE
ncbi:hypothetical protein AB07_1581 [Citrobacter freundii]|nr:hypothetical protein AB07_1581 [Citrobacter freundii]